MSTEQRDLLARLNRLADGDSRLVDEAIDFAAKKARGQPDLVDIVSFIRERIELAAESSVD